MPLPSANVLMQRHILVVSPSLCKALGAASCEEDVKRAMNRGMSTNHAIRSALIGYVCCIIGSYTM